MFRQLIAVAAALVVSCMAVTSAQAGGKALIVGIDEYAVPKLRLVGSVEDAKAMRDFAIRRWGFAPDDVKTLLDGAADKAGILDALDRWLVAGTRPGDTVLFYFSGHGHHVFDADGDERADDPNDDQDEVLVAHDGALNADETYRGFVVDDEIAARLRLLRDRRVVVIVDSCHSGTTTRGVGAPDGEGVTRSPDFGVAATATRSVSDAEYRGARRIQPDFTDGVDQVIAFFAAGSTQLAEVNRRVDPPRGVFTEAFLRGAGGDADANGNGIVSVAEIESFTRTQAEGYCERNPCKTGMTPFIQAPPEMMAKDLITVVQAPTLQQMATDALGPGSEAEAVRIAVSPAGPVPIGREITISLTSPIEGTLVLIDLPPDDNVTLMFPNQHTEGAHGVSRRVGAGETVKLPQRFGGYSLPASGPPGRGAFLALVIQDDIRFERLRRMIDELPGLPASRGGFAPVPDPMSFLGELGKKLVEPWTGELTTRGVRWAMGHYEYEIVE